MYLFKNNLLPHTFDNLILWTNQFHNYNTTSSNQSFLCPFLCSSSGSFLFQYIELRHLKCFLCFSINVILSFFEKISTFTSAIPCFLSLLLLLNLLVCGIYCSFHTVPTILLLFTSAQEPKIS